MKFTRLVVTHRQEKRLILVGNEITQEKVLQKLEVKLNVKDPKVHVKYMGSFLLFDEDVAQLMNTQSD